MTLINQLKQHWKTGFKDLAQELPKIKHGLETGGYSVHETNSLGTTPLSYLVSQFTNQERVLPIVKLLIEHGADVNQIDEDNGSLLYSSIKDSARYGYPFTLARELIQAGADVNYSNEDRWTPLHEITSIFSNTENTEYRHECFKMAIMLLEAGADVNTIERNNYLTPLSDVFYQARSDDSELTKSYINLLLQHGADPEMGVVAMNASPMQIAREFMKGDWEDIFKVQIERLKLENFVAQSEEQKSTTRKQKL